MGLYLIIAITFFIASTLGTLLVDKRNGYETTLKDYLLNILLSIGLTVAVTGENIIIGSLFVSALYMIIMYKSVRLQVDKVWENKDINGKIDNFAEKIQEKKSN